MFSFAPKGSPGNSKPLAGPPRADSTVEKYSADQPRHPKGQSEGGQFAPKGAGGAGGSKSSAGASGGSKAKSPAKASKPSGGGSKAESKASGGSKTESKTEGKAEGNIKAPKGETQWPIVREQQKYDSPDKMDEETRRAFELKKGARVQFEGESSKLHQGELLDEMSASKTYVRVQTDDGAIHQLNAEDLDVAGAPRYSYQSRGANYFDPGLKQMGFKPPRASGKGRYAAPTKNHVLQQAGGMERLNSVAQRAKQRGEDAGAAVHQALRAAEHSLTRRLMEAGYSEVGEIGNLIDFADTIAYNATK